jgi:hypothetical protein
MVVAELRPLFPPNAALAVEISGFAENCQFVN